LYNYYYKLTAEAIEGTKAEVIAYPEPIVLVIKALTQDEAFEIGKSRINMEDWELDRTEDA